MEDGKSFPYFVELDNATQAVYSEAPGSWQSKELFYEACRDYWRATGGDDSIRVLILTTGGPERLKNILEAAACFMGHKERSIFYGMPLAAYLAAAFPLADLLFLDNLRAAFRSTWRPP